MRRRYTHEGELIDRYLNNIERQNLILLNIIETVNRQTLASRNLINSYINPFAPRYRDTNFNRNWNNTLSAFPRTNLRDNLTRETSVGTTRSFSDTFMNPTRSRTRPRNRRTRVRTQTTQTRDNGTTNQPNIFLQTILSMLSPVRISPSAQQIENATERYNYNSDESINCPIDREPINRGDNVIRIRHCGHIFRSDNLNTWFEHNPRCPLCRYDIRNYEATNNNSSLSSTTVLPHPPPPPPPPPPSLPENATITPSPTTLPQPPPQDSLPEPPNVPAPVGPPATHNAETSVLNEETFNNLSNIFNFTNTENANNLSENIFSTIIQNMPIDELNNLNSINLDISGNTASLSFEGIIPASNNNISNSSNINNNDNDHND